MNHTFQDLMRDATRLTQAGRLHEATAAIQRALSGAAGVGAVPPRHTNSGAGATVIEATLRPDASPLVLDGCVFEVDAGSPATAATVLAETPASGAQSNDLQAWPRPTPDDADDDADAAAQAGRGEFTRGTHTHASQTRRYQLYAPPGQIGRRLPLVARGSELSWALV